MTPLFTPQAADQMRQMLEKEPEDPSLRRLIERIRAAEEAPDPDSLAETVRVAAGPNGKLYVTTSGDKRAVLSYDPSDPETMVVTGIYQTVSFQGPRGRVELGVDAADVADMLQGGWR